MCSKILLMPSKYNIVLIKFLCSCFTERKKEGIFDYLIKRISSVLMAVNKFRFLESQKPILCREVNSIVILENH